MHRLGPSLEVDEVDEVDEVESGVPLVRPRSFLFWSKKPYRPIEQWLQNPVG